MKATPYNPTEEMRWAMKRIDPALSSEQCRALWSAAWSAAPAAHPAPSVPADVVRDAERYRWLADCNNYEAGLELIIDPKLTAHTLGEKIDAAMLAATVRV